MCLVKGIQVLVIQDDGWGVAADVAARQAAVALRLRCCQHAAECVGVTHAVGAPCLLRVHVLGACAGSSSGEVFSCVVCGVLQHALHLHSVHERGGALWNMRGHSPVKHAAVAEHRGT